MPLQELKSVVKLANDHNARTVRVRDMDWGEGRRRALIVTVGTRSGETETDLEFLLAPGRTLAEDVIVPLNETPTA